MENKSYKDLIVWQKSIDLAEKIYQLVKFLPDDERYVLSSQSISKMESCFDNN